MNPARLLLIYTMLVFVVPITIGWFVGDILLAAAPVPPPSKELTSVLVVGEWEYQYLGSSVGMLTIKEDGTYESTGPTGKLWETGKWTIKNGTSLILTVDDPQNWWKGIYDSQFDFSSKNRWRVGVWAKTPAEIARKPNDLSTATDTLPPRAGDPGTIQDLHCYWVYWDTTAKTWKHCPNQVPIRP